MTDISEKVRLKLIDLLSHAYAPYSHFPVACGLITEDGSEFYGVNVENASYGLALCAEGSAIANMITHGYQKIVAIHVMAEKMSFCAPCGACRQRLFEFSDKNTMVYLYDSTDSKAPIQHLSFHDLLPLPFQFNPI
jgi:cytidine deaminase